MLGADSRRMEHARRVYVSARAILESDEGACASIVLPSAILHDIGIPEALRKYGSAAGLFQEIEGPPIARRILEDSGYSKEAVEEICAIIGSHHSPSELKTSNSRVLNDADWLVNITEEGIRSTTVDLRKLIERVFLTQSGRNLAEKVYLSDEAPPWEENQTVSPLP